MKQSLILLFTVCALSHYSNSQNSNSCKLTELIKGGGTNFQVVGIESNAFVDSLFAELPKTKRKGYIWKFKNLEIAGLSEPVTLQVHQGIQGGTEKKSDSSCCGSRTYFHTFTSEKYKQQLLSKQTELEQPGIIIYVKRGRNYGLKSKEETEILRDYLVSIFEG